MTTLSESIKKVEEMGRDVGEFKRNVGKVVVFLETFEYEEVLDVPSYGVSALRCIHAGHSHRFPFLRATAYML